MTVFQMHSTIENSRIKSSKCLYLTNQLLFLQKKSSKDLRCVISFRVDIEMESNREDMNGLYQKTFPSQQYKRYMKVGE